MAPNGSLILTNHVDFEEIRDTYNRVPYTISLSVNDSLHTATTAVCVGVTDANDNEPIFDPPSRTLMVNEVRQTSTHAHCTSSRVDCIQHVQYMNCTLCVYCVYCMYCVYYSYYACLPLPLSVHGSWTLG